MPENSVTYTVVNKREEVSGVKTLFLSKKPKFESGQYINIYFPETGTPEGKAYSISSAPDESEFAITVRGIGEFSNRLCELEVGDTFQGSLPYGFFHPESPESELVMIAAGIGITPFRSIILETAGNNPTRHLHLFHSVRTASDTIFKKEFEKLEDKLPNLSLNYFITREGMGRRITVGDIMQELNDQARAEFMICGSIPFVRDIWRALREAGISEDQLYTEAFFSH